tara:strand:+ start:405 stop:1289 length:885 start_codon:yes stop_codon:yes gene_type:complete
MILGVLLSIISSILFGALFFFSTLLEPLEEDTIFGWRIITTLPFVTLFIFVNQSSRIVCKNFLRLKKNPLLIFPIIFSSCFIGYQLWLFLWAPLNNKAIEISLGYFILPLVMVIAGKLFFREKLSFWQKLAALSSLICVLNVIIYNGTFSFEVISISFGYPFYFWLKKKFYLNNLTGLWIELVLLVPISIWFITNGNLNNELIQKYPKFYYLIPLLGFVSACALASYFLALKILNLSLLGLLGYIEPILMLLVGFLIGEKISSSELLTYIAIWFALIFLIIEGILYFYKKKIHY